MNRVYDTVNVAGTLLVYEGARSFGLTEENLQKAMHCRRVEELEDACRCGVPVESTYFQELAHNQPVINYMLQPDEEGRWQWNGRLLFCTDQVDEAAAMVHEHGRELGIVMAFIDPLNGRYHMLVQTDGVQGPDLALRQERMGVRMLLRQYLSHVTSFKPHVMVRVVPESFVDLIDRRAMFGTGHPTRQLALDAPKHRGTLSLLASQMKSFTQKMLSR